MTRVMLCGSCEPSDIKLLVEEGAHGIGLITEVRQKLPCRLSLEQARSLRRLIPPLVTSILIITEEQAERLIFMAKEVNPDAVQLHGFNAVEQVAFLKRKLSTAIIKTLHWMKKGLAEGADPERCAREYVEAGADAILLDTMTEEKVGSTGLQFPLELARRIRDAIYPSPLILAGGLNEKNIINALAKVQPFAVDAFSSVTTAGRLERKKVTDFLQAVMPDLPAKYHADAYAAKGNNRNDRYYGTR